METDLLSVDDITKIIKICEVTAQRWCRDRRFPAAKIGKSYPIGNEDIDSWYEGKLLDQTTAEH